MDQQDYLGVLLGDPSSFGSSAGSQALKATPANKGIYKSGLHSGYVVSVLLTQMAVELLTQQSFVCQNPHAGRDMHNMCNLAMMQSSSC